MDENELSSASSSSSSSVYRLFRTVKPMHRVLGGGKPADLFMWTDIKVSGAVLTIATFVWVLFDVLKYHFAFLACRGLILVLIILFVWSNAATYMSKSCPSVPEVRIPEQSALKFASALISEINRFFAALEDVASGQNLTKFFSILTFLWLFSILGSWCGLLTLLYTITVALLTLPLLYENYQTEVDTLAGTLMAEIKRLRG